MKLIAWQDIWITLCEIERLGSQEANDSLLNALLELGAFDDRGVWNNDGAREARS